MINARIVQLVSPPDWPVLRQLVSFGAIGAVSTCVDVIAFNLLVGSLRAMPANLCSYLTGMSIGWLLNKRYTFGSADRCLSLRIFVGINTVALALTTVAVQAAALVAPNDRLLVNLTKLAAGGTVMLLKFGVLRTSMTYRASGASAPERL